jgi:glycyl-tRNA synthetase
MRFPVEERFETATTVDGSTADRQPDGAPVAAPVNDTTDSLEKRDPARLEKVVNLCKRRGFVFPSGEIYGGTRSAWDYGPLGVELKENIKRQWWRTVVQSRDDIVGLDSSVILPRQVWVASGHVGVFTDPLTECQSCHKRFRADHLIEAYEEKKGRPPEHGLADISCPNCGTKGAWTEPRDFNMMLKTFLGPVEDESGLHYLRPETAQGIFVNFANVMGAARKKPPFGIGQIGKSFRNEITPGNFIFRTREFEQMEMEYFVEPGTDEEWHQYWIDQRTAWYTDLGIDPDNLRHFEHPKDKLSHYSKRTVDIEYRFGFQGSEWGELEGIANRTDFDLKTHTEHSGTDLSYFDQATNTRWTPYVIEPAAGLTRSLMAFLIEAYTEDEAPNAKGGVDTRTVLRLDPRLAPVKAAVLPLSRNADLSPKAKDLAAVLRKNWNVDFDDAGAIGRRYRRQDEVGTPFCITVDFDTLDDNAVTIRERDSMSQDRVGLDAVESYLKDKLPVC